MAVEKELITVDSYINEMVDWANPPSVSDLKADFDEARQSHNTHISKVTDWIDILRGKRNFTPLKNRSAVVPKLVRKQNEWRYAALEEPFLSTDDMFKVNPVTADDVESAKQNELILNKQFRVDIPRVQFINKFIRTAVNTGTVIIKLAWESETGIVNEEQMQDIFAQNEDEAFEFLMFLVQSGQMAEEQMMEIMESGQWTQIPVDQQPITVQVEKTYINRPVLEIKDSRKVIIDPSCEGNIDNAQFIIDKFLTDLSTLRKDGRYTNLDIIQEKEYNSRSDTDYDPEYNESNDFNFKDRPRQKLTAYEYWGYWDINDDGIVVPIVATWIGNTMIRLEENPYPDKKLPFVVIQYLPPDTNVVHGDADASLLEDNQNIIGAVTRSIVDLIGRSANAQQGIRKDLLDPTNMDNFKLGLDFEYNPVPNIGDALFTTKLPEIPRSALELIQLQNNEAEALTGVKAFSAGISGDALGSQVGGIRSALDATAKRELGILRRLSNGLKEVGKKIITMNSVWLSDEEIIRISDEDRHIKRDDLAGNFDLVLNISTAEADNQKASELAFMLQTIGNSVPFDIMKIVLIKIAELRKLPDLAMAIKEYEPQPDPLQQAKTQAEIEYIKANTQKDVTAAGKNVADEVLKYAKADEAGAKGRKTHSDADMVDLDYLEQINGLQQDRELEQIDAKAKASLIKSQAKQSTKSK